MMPRNGVSATTMSVYVTLLICCLQGVLFLRGAAVPHHTCRVLPPVLSVTVDHSGGTDMSAPACDADRPPRAAAPRTALASERTSGPNRVWLRSQLPDIALPPPAAA